MDSKLITYQKFNDIGLANELAEQLGANGIVYQVEEESLTFNPSFALNDELSKEYAIKIYPADFERVNELLKQNANENIGGVEKGYYLFDFTEEELKEVVTKADEWSAFDVQLARKLLADRGKAISDKEIKTIEEKRMEELKLPDEPQTGWIIIGYLFAFLGGILGVFIGWHLSNYKKTLPDGERVYEYLENDRKQGKRIFYIAIIVTIICIGYKLSQIFE